MRIRNLLLPLALALGTLFPGSKAFAQAAAYAFSQSTGTYTPLSGATVLIDGSAASFDDETFLVSLPLPFVFNGATYNDVYVSANGYISFGTTDPGTGTRTFLSTAGGITTGGVAGYSVDLWGNSGSSAAVSWINSGNITTFEWNNVGNYNSGNPTTQSYNFQIQLDHSNNTISTIYGSMTNPVASPANAQNGQVGIRTITSDFNNRTTTTDWANTTPGVTNSDKMTLSSTVFPTSGLTFTWTVPTCLPPSAITGSNIIATGADITFTEPTPAPANGYEYEVRSSGAAGSGSTGLDAFGTSPTGTTTVSVSTLIPNTTYTIYMRSNCGGGDFSNWIASTTFTTPPTCPAPTSPLTTTVTAVDATVDWTGTATSYEVEYGTVATLGDPGNIRVSGVVNPYLITGLNVATTYYWWVRAICSPGDSSTWTSVSNFTTACATIPAPYAEGFNTGLKPNCWTNSNSTGNTNANMFWKFNGSGTPRAITNTRPTSTFAWVDASVPNTAAAGGGTVTLTSPILDLSSLTTPMVKFDWYKYNQDPVVPQPNNNLLVEAYDGTAWITLMDDTSNSASWRTATFVLPASFIGATSTQFRFTVDKTLSGNFYDDVLLDSFSVDNVPTCFGPSTVATANITSNSVDISWTAPAIAPANGYEYEVRTSGAAGSGATGLVTSGTTAAGVTTASISALTSNTAYTVYVRGVCSATDFSSWSAGANFTTLISCFAPTAVTTANITATGADINWTAPATPPANGYEYEIRTSGAAGSGATGLATSGTTAAGTTTASLSGLAPAITYTVYVRSSCGAGDFSTWTTAVTFTTACTTIPAPYAEGFNTGFIPNCWTNSNSISSTTANLLWKFNGAGTPRAITNTRPTSTFAWVDASSPFNAVVTLTSPILDLSSLSTPTVKFDWYKYNQDPTAGFINNNLLVEAYDGTAWITVMNDTSNSASWRTVSFALPASFIGATSAQFRFSVDKTLSNNFYDDVLLDSFSVDDGLPVTCFAPTAVTITNVNTSSATINWTAPATPPANGYEYEVRTSGAAGSGAAGLVTSGTTAAGVTTANVTGLASLTTYTVYVRSVCSTTDFSSWTAAVTFTTISSCTKPVVTVNGVSHGTFTTCAGNPVALTATGAATYVWTPVAGLSCNTCANPIATPTAGTTYYVVGSNGVGCSDTDTVMIVVNPNPTVNAGPDASTCGGSSSTQLNATGTGISTYSWSPSTGLGCTTCANPVASPTTTTTYRVIVSNTFGCSDTDFVVVSVSGTAPVVNLGNDTTVCVGSTLTLNAGNPGLIYLWSTGAVTQTIPVTTAGTYSVTVDNGSGCVGRDTINISSANPPVVNLGNNATICAGSSLTLNAGPGTSYLWNTGAITQSLVVATAGTYSVVVTNAAGCTGTDAINIAVSPLPVVNLGNDTMLCTGASFALDARNTGASYVWNTGATTQTITVSTAGSYSVTVTNAAGCMGMDAINVMPGTLPVAGNINVSGSSPTFTFSAVGSSMGIHGWDFGDGGVDTAAVPTHTYTANGTYTVHYYVANPCGIDTADAVVTVANAAVNTVSLEGEVTLAPNPASDRVLIRNTSAQAMKHITVLNAVGAVVRENTPQNGKEQSIDLSGLAAATYMVRIEFDGGAIVVRRLQITQ